VMSEQKVPRSVEQRIVIKFLVGENVPSAEIHHRLQQQYGEESRSYLNHLVEHRGVTVKTCCHVARLGLNGVAARGVFLWQVWA